MVKKQIPPYTELADQLLDREWNVLRKAKNQLEQAGLAAVPHLLKVLEEPRFHIKHQNVHAIQDTPLEALLDLLSDWAPPEAVEPTARLLENLQEEVRKHASTTPIPG